MEYSSDTESIPKVIRGKRTEDKEENYKRKDQSIGNCTDLGVIGRFVLQMAPIKLLFFNIMKIGNRWNVNMQVSHRWYQIESCSEHARI